MDFRRPLTTNIGRPSPLSVTYIWSSCRWPRSPVPAKRQVRTVTIMKNMRHPTGLRLVALAFGIVLASGCYNGPKLVEQARSAAQRTRLAEVDLGTFHTTMPKDSENKSLTE